MKLDIKTIVLLVGAFAVGFFGFKYVNQYFKTTKEVENSDTNINLELDDGFVTLFDGKTFKGWHVYGQDSVSSQWSIQNGEMTFTPLKDESNGMSNLMTDKSYTSFILSLEWKISKGGNSGVFWGVLEDEKFVVPYLTGPEIQILDDENHPDAENKSHSTGAIFDMVIPKNGDLNPAGEWNDFVVEINQEKNYGKVRLNGDLITEFPVNGSAWKELISNSKFKTWENFGIYQTGKIGLQDHGNEISFRNIKIKEL